MIGQTKSASVFSQYYDTKSRTKNLTELKYCGNEESSNHRQLCLSCRVILTRMVGTPASSVSIYA